MTGRAPTPESPHTPAPSRRPTAAAVRLLGAAIVTGFMIGGAAWLFLEALDAATRIRVDHRILIALLPAGGLAIGLVHHRFGGPAREGSLLILRKIRRPGEHEPVPARMAPLVGGLTVASHLFGASVGREGAALQIGGSLGDQIRLAFRIEGRHRRILLIASVGGAFGAVFGVPWAGLVFGLELHRRHLPDPRRERVRLLAGALAPTAIVSFAGDAVVRFLGHDHGLGLSPAPPVDLRLVAVAMLIGLLAGLTATGFTAGTAAVRRFLERIVPAPAARPAIGGIVVLGLVAIAGTEHLGLSLPLRDAALLGELDSFGIPLWKLAFTIVCVGAGFIGGEVTPLFVVGSTLGAATAAATGVDPAVGAVIGFATVFGGAARTPLACAVMTAELLGIGSIAPVLVATVTAQLPGAGGRLGIYGEPGRPGPVRASRGDGSSGRGSGSRRR